MTIANRPADPLAVALRSGQPLWSLRDAAHDMLARGISSVEVLDRLDALRSVVRQGSRPEDEDLILDVMDMVEGWAPPHLRL